MNSTSVHTGLCVLMPGAASDVGRLPQRQAAAGRCTVTRAADREHRTVRPFPSSIAAELQKANAALVSSMHLRRYVERLISEQRRKRG
jgi:hypothetical protein